MTSHFKGIHLAPVTPRGVATGEVESISGFAVNLSRRHSVLTTTLLRNAIAVLGSGSREYAGLAIRPPLLTVDGYGKFAVQMTGRLETLTRNQDLSGSTLLMLRDVLNPMGHASLHQQRHWCDECFLVDIAGPGVPYQRLNWCVKSSSHCARHRCRLSSLCPACQSPQPYFPSLPFLGHCDACAQPLFRSSRQGISEDGIELVKSIYVHELVAAMQTLKAPLEHQKFVEWLNAVCHQYRDSSERMAITTLTSVDSSNLRRWLSGQAKPSLDVLLHFCATLRCSPASMITGQPSLIDFQAVRRTERPKLSVRVHRSVLDNEKIKQHLFLALRRPVSDAPSLKAVAKELASKVSYLTWRFPDLATRIRDRARKSRIASAKTKLSEHKAQLLEVLEALDQLGTYPSTRNIRQRSKMSASVLAKPELRKILDRKRAACLRARLFAQKMEA